MPGSKQFPYCFWRLTPAICGLLRYGVKCCRDILILPEQARFFVSRLDTSCHAAMSVLMSTQRTGIIRLTVRWRRREETAAISHKWGMCKQMEAACHFPTASPIPLCANIKKRDLCTLSHPHARPQSVNVGTHPKTQSSAIIQGVKSIRDRAD